MDEDVSIINANTRNERIKNFLLKNKNLLISIILTLVFILVAVYSFDKYKTNKKKEISEKFNLATIDYSKNTKDKTVNSLIEVINEKDPGKLKSAIIPPPPPVFKSKRCGLACSNP